MHLLKIETTHFYIVFYRTIGIQESPNPDFNFQMMETRIVVGKNSHRKLDHLYSIYIPIGTSLHKRALYTASSYINLI